MRIFFNGKVILQTIIFRASDNGLIRVEGTGNASSLQRFIRLLYSRGDSLPFRSTEKEKNYSKSNVK